MPYQAHPKITAYTPKSNIVHILVYNESMSDRKGSMMPKNTLTEIEENQRNDLEDLSWSSTKAVPEKSVLPTLKSTKLAWENEETEAQKLEKRILKRREERIKRRSFSSDEDLSQHHKDDSPSLKSISESSTTSLSSLNSDSGKLEINASPQMASSKEGMLYLKRKNTSALPILSNGQHTTHATELEERKKTQIAYKAKLSNHTHLPKLETTCKQDGLLKEKEEKSTYLKK